MDHSVTTQQFPGELRADFPALAQQVHGHPLVYLDNAATTQKPQEVIDVVAAYYERDNANVHRGVHALSQRSTDLFEQARAKVQRHINAAHPCEVIFTKGCTEAINLVAASWGGANLKPGDVVLLTTMEHHSNIVPWQLVAERTGAVVKPIPITDAGEVDLEAYEALLDERVKLVGVKHVCNALGTVNPVAQMSAMAKLVGAAFLVDGAQALAHQQVDVQAIGADFYTMSGHKVYGPTGIGALYSRKELLEAMPPYQGGGDMIRTVSFEKTTYAELPSKFEAGTPHMAGAVGFGAALDFVNRIGLDRISAHEKRLTVLATQRLQEIPGVTVVGIPRVKAGIVSFVMDCAHPHDIGTVLDEEGVAIRTGHHCCMPLMRRLALPATARVSFALYNDSEDVDRLAQAVRRVRDIFG